MSKLSRMSRHERTHIKHFVRTVEEQRQESIEQADIEAIIRSMRSADEQVRARAVRQICPCRMPWTIFNRLRREAKRLQHDPSPLVRANARHIETDMARVMNNEARFEEIEEREESEPRGRRLTRHRRPRG